MLEWGARLLAIYSLIVISILIVHNAVQAYKHKAKEAYILIVILLIPVFIYFSNVI